MQIEVVDKFLKKIYTLEKFNSLGCRVSCHRQADRQTGRLTNRQLERTEISSIKTFHF